MKHTKGPWSLRYGVILAPNNEYIIRSNCMDHSTMSPPYAVQEANLKLIAVAPEMFAALELFCNRVERGEIMEVENSSTYEIFKALIKKAML